MTAQKPSKDVESASNKPINTGFEQMAIFLGIEHVIKL